MFSLLPICTPELCAEACQQMPLNWRVGISCGLVWEEAGRWEQGSCRELGACLAKVSQPMSPASCAAVPGAAGPKTLTSFWKAEGKQGRNESHGIF